MLRNRLLIVQQIQPRYCQMTLAESISSLMSDPDITRNLNARRGRCRWERYLSSDGESAEAGGKEAVARKMGDHLPPNRHRNSHRILPV